MAVWRDQILVALEPCTDERVVEAVVGKLLLMFEHGQQNVQATKARNQEYVEAVNGLPFWAILEAYERFRSGETMKTWNKAFRPTPPEFADEVREGLADLRRQQIQIRDILDAEVLPPVDPDKEAKARQAAADAIAGRLMHQQDEQRRAVEAEEAERDVVLAGPPLKAGALGAMALGNALSSRRFRQPVA